MEEMKQYKIMEDEAWNEVKRSETNEKVRSDDNMRFNDPLPFLLSSIKANEDSVDWYEDQWE